jgi:hypothetical protein
LSDTILVPEGAQAARPGRFSAFDSPLGYRRQPTPVFEPGLADLRTENMRGPSYAAMLHPQDTRGVVVMAYRDTYTKRDGTRGHKTANGGATGDELRRAVDVLEPFSITMNAFRRDPKDPDAHRLSPCKATWNLAGLNACWVDLDYYNRVAWRGRPPEEVAAAVLERCEDLGWPMPSYVLASGQGLLVSWLHTRQSPSALPVWRAMQKRILTEFDDFGPDRGASNPTMAFKLPGVQNEKSGLPARVVWPSTFGDIERHAFDVLRSAFLPYTPQQVAAHRKVQAKERAAKAEKRTARKAAGIVVPPPKLTYNTFAKAVLRDLTRLFEHRFGGRPVRRGNRDTWLFAFVKAAAWMMTVRELEAEVDRLAPLCGLSQREARGYAKAAVRKAKRAEQGGLDPRGGGKNSDPRYKLNPEHFVGDLGVTVAEMRDKNLDLRVLLSDGVKREREAKRSQDRRDAAGAKSRTAAQAARLALGQRALEKRAAGMTVAAVAAEEGVSVAQVEKAQREARQVAAIGKPVAKAKPGRPRKPSRRTGFDKAASRPAKTRTENPYGSTGSIDACARGDVGAGAVVASPVEGYDVLVRSIAPHCDDTDARSALTGPAGVFVSEGGDLPDFLRHLIPGAEA